MFVPSGFTKADLTNSLVSASYLVAGALVLVYANASHHPTIVMITMAAIAAAGLVAWLAAHKRYHVIVDTPTSKIISASQGYVELVGRCKLHPGSAALGFGPIPSCVWLQYTVHRKIGGEWRQVDSGRSSDTFLLVDDSGECVVDPDHAEVLSVRHQRWNDGQFRHSAQYLLAGDTLYALGELHTLGGARVPQSRQGDTAALLREWKRDQAHLLSRFDANKDGTIDLQEWETVRQAATRTVDERHQEMRLRPDIHLLKAPSDARPYLLSNRDPAALAHRYRRWSWLHLAVFMVTTVGSLILWRL